MRRRAIMLAAVMLLCAVPTFCQSCAMCYGSAKSTSKEGQNAINKGVIVLFIPPFAFLTLGFWMAIRYGNKRDLEQGNASETPDQPQLWDSFSAAPPHSSSHSSLLQTLE
jgi:membrane glycosyltransferase